MPRSQQDQTHFVVVTVRRPTEIFHGDTPAARWRIDLQIWIFFIRVKGDPQTGLRVEQLTGRPDKTGLYNPAVIQYKVPDRPGTVKCIILRQGPRGDQPLVEIHDGGGMELQGPAVDPTPQCKIGMPAIGDWKGPGVEIRHRRRDLQRVARM